MLAPGQLCPEDLPEEVWEAVSSHYHTEDWKPSPSHHAEYRDARTAVQAFKALIGYTEEEDI